MNLTNHIYLGDCISIMPCIDSHSIDLILCDLPYGTTDNKWDIPIPFESLWKEYERLIKPNGTIILFGQNLFSHQLVMSNPKLYRYSLVWEKTNAQGFLNANKKPLTIHEDIHIFSKGKITYHPQMTIGKPYSKKRTGKCQNYQSNNRIDSENYGTRYPTSIIHISNPNNNSVHPTQKPVPLFEYLINTYSNEGDLILDNCIGSGTTAIACLRTNRKYIGIEKEIDYYRVCMERIKSEREQIKLEYYIGGDELCRN